MCRGFAASGGPELSREIAGEGEDSGGCEERVDGHGRQSGKGFRGAASEATRRDGGEEGVEGEERQHEQQEGVEVPGLREVPVQQSDRGAGTAAAGAEQMQVAVDWTGRQQGLRGGWRAHEKSEAARCDDGRQERRDRPRGVSRSRDVGRLDANGGGCSG